MNCYREKYYGTTKEILYVVLRRKILLKIFKNGGCYRKDVIDSFSEKNKKASHHQILDFIKNGLIEEYFFDDEKKDIFLKITDYGTYLYCMWFFSKKMKDVVLLLGTHGDLRVDEISKMIFDYSVKSMKSRKTRFENCIVQYSSKLKEYCKIMEKRKVLQAKDSKKDTLYALTENGVLMYNSIKDKIGLAGFSKNESFK